MNPDLIPSDPLMAAAWAGCLQWAVGDETILAQFQSDTGVVAPPMPRNAIEAMIDDAAGVNNAIGEKFIRWFNENVWGDLELVAGDSPRTEGDA